MLTRENLGGVWAGLPTPFDSKGNLDTNRLAENIRRTCQFDVGGVYSTGGTGEFYALESDEFERMTDVFVSEAHAAGKPVQIGVSWSHTRGVIQRMEYARQAGADGVQVALPYWFTVSEEEAFTFFKDISRACPDLPIIHYNSLRARRVLNGADYHRIASEVPELIGTKFISGDTFTWQNLMAQSPELAHMGAPEMALPTVMMYGGRGCYSIFIVVVPELMLRLYHLCVEKRWNEAIPLAERIAAFFGDAVVPLINKGYSDCALDKAMAEIGGLLLPSGAPRPPYRALSAEDMQFLRSMMQESYKFVYRK